MKQSLVMAVSLLLAGCTEQAEQVVGGEPSENTSPKQSEKDALSIEQAADQAVKLIEAEAKAATDHNSAEAE
jgi:hypothetical protein